jgi:adenine-specific DNA-methyltransferase
MICLLAHYLQYDFAFSLSNIHLLDDYPVRRIDDVWTDTAMGGFLKDKKKIYVVQTPQKVIERCILMTTDPSDLVLDPTCGSGTTAFCAEKWGRRWITIDTSRVALFIARRRIMAALFPYYQLAHQDHGVSAGFVYSSNFCLSLFLMGLDLDSFILKQVNIWVVL